MKQMIKVNPQTHCIHDVLGFDRLRVDVTRVKLSV